MNARYLVWFTAAIAVYHFVSVAQLPTWLGFFLPANIHLAASISSALILVYLLLPAGGRHAGEDTEAEGRLRRVPWYDWLFMASGVIGAGFVIVNHDAILDYG